MNWLVSGYEQSETQDNFGMNSMKITKNDSLKEMEGSWRLLGLYSSEYVVEPFERPDEPVTPENEDDDTITVSFSFNVTLDE